jgi:hypothetical protein
MGKHGSVRQQVLRQFPPQTRLRDPEEELASALYFMLWSIDDLTVDGWVLFRVVQESDDSLDAVGLMTLLPSGSVPIALNIRADEGGLTWSVQSGLQDRAWLALSDSKRWNNVYLYATGERETPPWAWGRQYQGRVLRTDD